MQRLQGRVAIVTGAGDGVGRGIARRFAAEGARVLVAELDDDRGNAAAEELTTEFGVTARFLHTDVRVKADNQAMVAAAVDEWGRLDILVNNAWSGGKLSRVELKTDELLESAIRVAFLGPFWAMQAAFRVMKASGYGRVINVCSLNGLNAHVGTAEYNSAKEALRTLTRTAAREWAPTGVVCNALCPAAKSAAFHRVLGNHPELVAAADGANPMGRIGDPEWDVAPVAVFLASEDCRYLTGNTLFVDGGAHINGSPWSPELGEEP